MNCNSRIMNNVGEKRISHCLLEVDVAYWGINAGKPAMKGRCLLSSGLICAYFLVRVNASWIIHKESWVIGSTFHANEEFFAKAFPVRTCHLERLRWVPGVSHSYSFPTIESVAVGYLKEQLRIVPELLLLGLVFKDPQTQGVYESILLL